MPTIPADTQRVIAEFHQASTDPRSPWRFLSVNLSLVDSLDQEGEQCPFCSTPVGIEAQAYFTADDGPEFVSACAPHVISRVILLAVATAVTVEVAA